jgi:hypothetical protein
MEINSGWNFKELINHLETLKHEYDNVLASFLPFDIKEKNDYIKSVRNRIYSLKLIEWQKDVCWEYMNGYRLYYDVLKIIKR